MDSLIKLNYIFEKSTYWQKVSYELWRYFVKFTSKLSILYKSFICKQNKLDHAGGSTWLILYMFLNNILLFDNRLFTTIDEYFW